MTFSGISSWFFTKGHRIFMESISWEMKNMCKTCKLEIKDHDPEPLVANIACLSQRNQNFRTALWTGSCLQLILMCIYYKKINNSS